MKILINGANLSRGGGVQVCHSFINALKSESNNSFICVLSSIVYTQIKRQEFSDNFTFYEYNKNINFSNLLLSKDRFLDHKVISHNVDVVFTVFGPTYWRPSVKHIAGYAKPHYIYKESPFYKLISNKQYIKLWLQSLLHLYEFKRYYDTIITETTDVTERLKKILKFENIVTVTNNYNQIFDDHTKWESTSLDFESKAIRLLTISSNYPHKNLNIIPRVIKYLKANYPNFEFKFILTVNLSDIDFDMANVSDNIELIGKVSVNECPSLYQKCDFLFLPTLLECFSASYAESMKMRTPILTSDLSFAHDICGNAAIYFNPLDPKDIADKIYQTSMNKTKQMQLIESGIMQLRKFDSATERARKYVKIIETTYNETNYPRHKEW